MSQEEVKSVESWGSNPSNAFEAWEYDLTERASILINMDVQVGNKEAMAILRFLDDELIQAIYSLNWKQDYSSFQPAREEKKRYVEGFLRFQELLTDVYGEPFTDTMSVAMEEAGSRIEIATLAQAGVTITTSWREQGTTIENQLGPGRGGSLNHDIVYSSTEHEDEIEIFLEHQERSEQDYETHGL